MYIKEGQEYLVLKKFNDCGANLEENEIILISQIKTQNQIYVDVLSSIKSWVICGEAIENNCALILPKTAKPLPKEIKEEKDQIKRYNKKEFKLRLKNIV